MVPPQVVYAVGAVPPAKRYPPVGSPMSRMPPVSLRDLTSVGEGLASRARSLPRTGRGGGASAAGGGATTDDGDTASMAHPSAALLSMATGLGDGGGIDDGGTPATLPAIDPSALLEEASPLGIEPPMGP